MIIVNKVKHFVCKKCGCNKTGLLVGTQKDFYEDCLGIDAEGIMTNGMNVEVPLRREVIEQQEGWCRNCTSEYSEVGVIATFEDGTVIDSESGDIIKYWMDIDI